MEAILGVVARWLHITSVVILLSAFFYAKFAGVTLQVTPRLRKWVLFATAALLLSGLYTLLNKTAIPAGYHMYFGIKMLLALHIIAIAFVITRPGGEAKASRLAGGVMYSALAVIALSAWLRWISLA